MNNITFGATFYCSYLLSSRSVGEQLYTFLDTCNLPPDKYNEYEPLRFQWGDRDAFLNLWCQQANKGLGWIIIQRNAPRWYNLGVFMPRGPLEKRHSIYLFIRSAAKFGGHELPQLVRICDRIFQEFELEYGYICASDAFEHDHKRSTPIPGGTREEVVGNEWPDCIPGLYWGNYFGDKYFEQGFGKRVSDLTNVVRLKNGVRVMNEGTVTDWATPESQASAKRIKETLGENWFFSKQTGMPSRALKTSKEIFRLP